MTGGHLKITKDLLDNIVKHNSADFKNFERNHKDYEINKDEFYKTKQNVQVFNCDLNRPDDLDEFTAFVEREKFKVKFYLNLGHPSHSLIK